MVKILIPFNELLKNKKYRDKIIEMVKGEGDFQLEILEVNYDAPIISFRTRLNNGDEEEVPPFYLSLNVHDMVVHNAMLDSRASHNLMQKWVVESMGLEVT